MTIFTKSVTLFAIVSLLVHTTGALERNETNVWRIDSKYFYGHNVAIGISGSVAYTNENYTICGATSAVQQRIVDKCSYKNTEANNDLPLCLSNRESNPDGAV